MAYVMAATPTATSIQRRSSTPNATPAPPTHNQTSARTSAVARLMPWSGPVPEVDLVVRHGKAVAPLLIRLMPDDPDDPALSYEHFDARQALAGQQFEWRVEQNAAVALCRIYHVSIGGCPMYGVRASSEYNRSVKPFWLKTIRENP